MRKWNAPNAAYGAKAAMVGTVAASAMFMLVGKMTSGASLNEALP
jgi:hypothetical protein